MAALIASDIWNGAIVRTCIHRGRKAVRPQLPPFCVGAVHIPSAGEYVLRTYRCPMADVGRKSYIHSFQPIPANSLLYAFLPKPSGGDSSLQPRRLQQQTIIPSSVVASNMPTSRQCNICLDKQDGKPPFVPTPCGEQTICQDCFEELFGSLSTTSAITRCLVENNDAVDCPGGTSKGPRYMALRATKLSQHVLRGELGSTTHRRSAVCTAPTHDA